MRLGQDAPPKAGCVIEAARSSKLFRDHMIIFMMCSVRLLSIVSFCDLIEGKHLMLRYIWYSVWPRNNWGGSGSVLARARMTTRASRLIYSIFNVSFVR